MFSAFPPLRSLRALLPVGLLTLSLAAATTASAQTTIQGLHAIGLEHAQAEPYNYTGRIFDVSNVGFGSGTLLRRHTVMTAGHVVYEPATGFLTYASFTRALYENYSLSQDQVIAAQALTGYQNAAAAETTTTTTGDAVQGSGDSFLAASSLDMGVVLIQKAPVGESWGNFVSTPTLLTSAPTFLVGYPGETFDGRTMAFVVPSSHWVPLGVGNTATSLYEIDDATAEPGTSGGPIYVVPDGTNQYVAASVVGTTLKDSTGEFNNFIIHAIDKPSARFIRDAEYSAGLIKRVKVGGPTTVSRGQTYTYTTKIKFSQPSRDGTQTKVTTDRYPELKLKTNTPGTSTLPLVTVKKTSNTTFSVTFSNNIVPGSQTTLQVYYDKTLTPAGNSALTVRVQ